MFQQTRDDLNRKIDAREPLPPCPVSRSILLNANFNSSKGATANSDPASLKKIKNLKLAFTETLVVALLLIAGPPAASVNFGPVKDWSFGAIASRVVQGLLLAGSAYFLYGARPGELFFALTPAFMCSWLAGLAYSMRALSYDEKCDQRSIEFLHRVFD